MAKALKKIIQLLNVSKHHLTIKLKGIDSISKSIHQSGDGLTLPSHIKQTLGQPEGSQTQEILLEFDPVTSVL